MINAEIRQVLKFPLKRLAERQELILLEELQKVAALDLNNLDAVLFSNQLSAVIQSDKTTYFYKDKPFIWFSSTSEVWQRQNKITFRLEYGTPETNKEG